MNNLGRAAEDQARRFMCAQGYTFLTANYMTKNGEVDLIFRAGGTLIFVEVKARETDRFGMGLESVTPFKQRQIAKAAATYIKSNRLLNYNIRFDVISIDAGRITHVPNAFDSPIRY